MAGKQVSGGAWDGEAEMKRMTNRLPSVCAVLAIVLLGGCATSPRGSRVGAVHHVVVCWLKESGNAEARDRIAKASHAFSDIPGVISVKAGTMLPSKRAIVDSTFDVAIVLVFPDEKTMKKYLVHPRHQKAVKDILQPLVKKILVYDFVEK
ncbi:Dabb family protein [Verrucomicrobiota bacterium]